MSDGKRFLLAVLLAAWAMAFAYSFYAYSSTPADGEGFTRGLNRVGQFLGWQAVAGLLGLASFAVSREAARGSGIRRVAAVPFWIALAFLALILGFYGWAMVSA